MSKPSSKDSPSIPASIPPLVDKLQKAAEKSQVSLIPVKTFMSRQVVKIREGTKIYSAVQTLATHRISGAPVTNSNDQLIGVITEYDLLLQTATIDVLQPITYTKNPVFLTPEHTIHDTLVLLHRKRLRWLPVISPNRQIEGIVTRLDVLNKLLSKGK